MIERTTKSLILVILTLSIVFAGCTTTETGVEDVTEETAEELVEPVEKEPDEAVEATESTVTEEFIVSEELRVETFQQVEVVIQELNNLIKAQEYEKWLTYLTDDYVDYYGAAPQLESVSATERLKNAGIVLETLEDYFIHVVVPSRANLRLDDLVFKDEDEVEAIMIIREQRYSVYKLRLIDNEWKIDS